MKKFLKGLFGKKKDKKKEETKPTATAAAEGYVRMRHCGIQ